MNFCTVDPLPSMPTPLIKNRHPYHPAIGSILSQHYAIIHTLPQDLCLLKHALQARFPVTGPRLLLALGRAVKGGTARHGQLFNLSTPTPHTSHMRPGASPPAPLHLAGKLVHSTEHLDPTSRFVLLGGSVDALAASRCAVIRCP